ncbi:MAG: hypothetical protein Q9215_003512 [Flavoplaca cf. flavocitrina]
MAPLNPAPNQRLLWLHTSGASRIPQPASPSFTVPSYAFSLWRDEDGIKNVPHLTFYPHSRYSPLQPSRSAPSVPTRPEVSLENPLPPKMETKIRTELKQYYHDRKRASHCRRIKYDRRSELGISKLKGAAVPPNAIHHSNVTSSCNKPRTFYWMAAAQRFGRCPGFVFGAVYKTWCRYHKNNPPLDHEHFFANLVQITETGPKSIHGIVTAHKLLADQVATVLTRMRQEIRAGTPFPHFLDKEVRRQQVLLVLTGDDHELSAPISFDSIRSESLSIAKEASSTVGKPYNMIRVPFIVAIKFILDLQERENAAVGSVNPASEIDWADTYDREAAEYADSVLQSFAHDTDAEQEWKFTTAEMRLAVERIEERERGEEPLPTMDVDMLDPRWE